MDLKIGSLDRASLKVLDDVCFFEEDNPSFDKAFIRHKSCADILLDANLFRESYLTYLLALECLFKDIYSLLRAKIFGPNPSKSQSAILITSSGDKHQKKIKLSDLLKTHKFNHDLAALIQMIKNLFPDLEKQDPPRFGALVIATDVKLDWIKERYQNPETSNYDWEGKCKALKSAIEQFVKEDLRNIYPEGI